MTKIALAAAALLVATGAAFAGSDHYDPANNNQPAVSVDTSSTASIKKSGAEVQQPIVTGANHDLFGNH